MSDYNTPPPWVWLLMHDRHYEGQGMGRVLAVFACEASANRAMELLKAADAGGALWIDTAEVRP